ncbi:MAG TPA: AzlD domain-containing protein [Chloroflexia bacterium]|jgi:uncharacterized membrane protein|nr:AzlD domain-containing protein [Chloroflexia bacterium]
MQIDPVSLATILAMALVTYATRVGGLWLMGRVTPSPRVEAWLLNIPGAVLVSIVTPLALSNGPADALAAGLTGLVAARTHNLLLAIGVGIGAAWVLRQLF